MSAEAGAAPVVPATPAPIETSAPSALPEPPESVRLPEPTPEPEPLGDAPRFKLKPKAPDTIAPPETPAATNAAAEPPPLVLTTPPAPASSEAPALAPPELRSPPPPRESVDVTDELAALTASLRPEEKPAFRYGLLAVAVLTVAAVGGGGYYAYRTFLTGPSASASSPAKPAAPTAQTLGNAMKTAESKAREYASVPGQLIGKAQDAISARRGNEQERVDAALEGRESSGKRALDTRTPDEIADRLGRAESPPPAQPSVVHLDLGSSTTPPPSAPSPALDVVGPGAEASAEFKAFVTSARINGVFQGNPPRALINGRTVRAGDLLDSTLGVVFQRVDASRKLVFFKDQTGAVVAKKY